MEYDFADTPQKVSLRRVATSRSQAHPQIIAFDVMLDNVGRGVPRSVACGREFTVVATSPYDGPNAAEIYEQQLVAVQSAEISALREAEADLARAKDTQQAVAETLRAITKVVKTKSDLCTLCTVRTGAWGTLTVSRHALSARRCA